MSEVPQATGFKPKKSVMIVGNDPVRLADWAIDFQDGFEQRSRPRIGIHYGQALYRDGDYYGRDVNQAARVVARAAGGEVLVTRPVVDVASDSLKVPLREKSEVVERDLETRIVARQNDESF